MVPVCECDRGGSGGGEFEIGDSSPSRPLNGGSGGGGKRVRGDCCCSDNIRFVRGGNGGGVSRAKSDPTGENDCDACDRTGGCVVGKKHRAAPFDGEERCTGVVGE